MRRILATLAIVVLVLSGCGDDDSEETSAPVSLPGQTNVHGQATARDDMEIEVDDNYFEPTFVKAKAGQRFSVELHNEGSSRHTFTSAELGVDLELAGGDKRTVSLTAPATGMAGFHCRFHQGQGMQGAVFVG